MSDTEWRSRVDVLLSKQDLAIKTFQWVTNNIPMTIEQRVRLGDAIVLIYDEGSKLRAWIDGNPDQESAKDEVGE